MKFENQNHEKIAFKVSVHKASCFDRIHINGYISKTKANYQIL